MRDYCEVDCATCRVCRVFKQCPRGVVDDSVVEYVLDALQIGYDEGMRFAEQAIEYALEVEAPALRRGATLSHRN